MERSESRNRILIAVLLFLAIAGYYWKLTLTRQFEWMMGPDLAEQVLPWFQMQAQEWHAGRVPLWDPNLWAGQPLFGQAITGAAYPLNWILFLLPLENGHIAGWALTWYYVVIHLMAAGFCYLFCRSLGRSRSASLAGGIIFSLSGFMGNTPWPVMMNGAVWIPLVFLFQLRASRGRRPVVNAALSGMFLGIAFLSGHHQVPIFTAVAWVGVWIYLLFRNRRLLVPAAVALLFAGLSGAMQTLPAYEYGRLAKRWVGAPEPLAWNQPVPYSVHAYYDLKAFSLFGIVFPGVKMHFDPFLGVVAFSLALFAVSALWRDGRVRLLAALALAVIVYALGHNSVFQGALYGLIPELDKARTASAAVVLFQFAAAALAAFGIDELAAAWTARGTWILAGFGALTLADRRGPDPGQQADLPGRRPRDPDRGHRAARRGAVRGLAPAGADVHAGARVAGAPDSLRTRQQRTVQSRRPLRPQSDAVARPDARQRRHRRVPPQAARVPAHRNRRRTPLSPTGATFTASKCMAAPAPASPPTCCNRKSSACSAAACTASPTPSPPAPYRTRATKSFAAPAA